MLWPDMRFFRAESNLPNVAMETVEAEAFAALKRKDIKKALELFEKLAALGSKVACYCIGDIYQRGGGGIEPNMFEAKKWYERAFTSSIPKVSLYAAIRLGYIYGAGYDETNRHGAAVNYGKAFEYFKLLEDSDIAIGLLRLGIMYETGKGTPENRTKALKLYRRATYLGHVIARKYFGVLTLKMGNIPLGLLLWASAIAEGFFLGIFKPHSPRIAIL